MALSPEVLKESWERPDISRYDLFNCMEDKFVALLLKMVLQFNWCVKMGCEKLTEVDSTIDIVR